MLDFTKQSLPTYIKVEGIFYDINCSFSYGIMFANLCESGTAVLKDFDFMYPNQKPADKMKGFQELVKFFFTKDELPRPVFQSNGEQLLDYAIDSDLLYSAFMQQYHIDLVDCATSLHWYKFKALLAGLKDTKLNEVMGYRGYDPSDKTDFKKQMRLFKEAWKLEQKLTADEEEQLRHFEEIAGK